jgi:hypothetical protein
MSIPGLLVQQPILQQLNNSRLTGIQAMPAKDSTSDGTSDFSMMRRRFSQTYSTAPLGQANTAQRAMNSSNRYTVTFAAKTGPSRVVDSSDVIARRKAAAIGAGSMNASGGPMTFMSNSNKSIVDNAVTRVRYGGAGCVPKKVTQKYLFMASPPSTMAQPLKPLYPSP